MKKKVIGILIFFNFIFPTVVVSGAYNIVNSKNIDLKNLPHSNHNIEDMIDQVEKSLVYSYLENFTEFGPKDTGNKNCRMAGEYIFNEFKKMELDVYYHDWKFIRLSGKNVIATLNGSDPNSDAIFIVCAHYDTINGSPGANDDGSGIAAMLTVANIMHKYRFNHTIRFIAFSGHEQGTFGSFAYVKKAYAQGDNIVGVLNMDLIGNTTESGKVIQLRNPNRAEWISQYTKEILNKYYSQINLFVETVTDEKPGADETSFLCYGYDAVLFFTPNWWDHVQTIHSPKDVISTINFDFLTNVTKLVLAVTAELANKPIDVQIRIVSPKEGHFQIFTRFPIRLPGFNLYFFFNKLRGITYIHRRLAIIKVNITSNEDINAVYYSIDGVGNWRATFYDTSYDWKIKDSLKLRQRFPGVHKIGVTVTTITGKTAHDEMDVFIFPLI